MTPAFIPGGELNSSTASLLINLKLSSVLAFEMF